MAKYCLTTIVIIICAVKNAITLNALCSQKKDQKCHLLKMSLSYSINAIIAGHL